MTSKTLFAMAPRPICLALLFLCCSDFSTVHTSAQTLHTTDQVILDVRSVTWKDSTENSGEEQDDDTPWEFQSSSGRSLSGSGLIRWGSWSGILTEPAVWLSDGSWLSGDLRWREGDLISVSSDWFEQVAIPLTNVRAAVLRPSASYSEWLWLQREMQEASGTDDHIWLDRGNAKPEHLRGIVRFQKEADSAASAGSIGRSISIEVQGENLRLADEDIVAIVISPTLQPALESFTKSRVLGLHDGSCLRIRQLKQKNSVLQLETVGGVALSSIDSPQRFAKEIRHLRTWSDKVLFVSDLDPVQYRHIPVQTSLTWDLGIDRDALGNPLTTDINRPNDASNTENVIPPHRSLGYVAKGLGMHSDSRVAYRWDGSQGRFLAEVGFAPPQTGADPDLGSARCQLLVAKDGALVELDSFSISRSGVDAPVIGKISADITGAKLVVLVTESADLGQVGDHVLWLDARISRP